MTLLPRVGGILKLLLAAALTSASAKSRIEWSHEPFTLDNLLRYRHASQRCGLEDGAYNASDVANLAVGRTGSESLKRSFKHNHIFHHHNHDCSVGSVVTAGAKEIIVTIRHPVSRVISGIQRRGMESSVNRKKLANRQFVETFIQDGVVSCNPYLDALRNSSHPNHSQALNVTFGHNRQNYMMPLVEFYLNVSNVKPYDTKEKALNADVWFLCTESLTQDFNKAASFLGLNEPMHDHIHTSPVRSEEHKEDVERISEVNRGWLEEIYAKDLALHSILCDRNSTLRHRPIKLWKVLDLVYAHNDKEMRVRRRWRKM